MRFWFRHIRNWLPVALLCLGLSSCIYDDGDMADEPGEGADLMVSFTLRMERNRSGREVTDHTLAKAGSRAYDYDKDENGNPWGPTWGDKYPTDPGNEFDNRLLKEHFHMLLLEKETNKVVGKMEHDKMDVLIYDPYEEYTIVQFWGELKTNLSTEELSSDDKYKVMIFANGDNACGTELGAGIDGDGITFSHAGQPSNNFKAIPMWGVADAKLAGIKPGQRWNITGMPEQGTDPIWMLRAMAKIVVDVDTDEKTGELTDAVKGVKLTSLTVSNCNTNGAMLPANWRTIKDTKSLEIKNTLRIPASPSATTGFGKDLKVTENEKGVTRFEFYVPEYDNENTEIPEFVITVGYTVDGTEKEPGKIHICKYADGKPVEDANGKIRWPIVRNHIYQYTITGVEPTEEHLRFKVTIADMEKGGVFNYEYDFDE